MIFLYTINLKCFMIFMILNIYNQILIGYGYDDNDNDVLLLDISDNNNYKWTEIFDPSMPPEPSPSPTPKSPSSPLPTASPTSDTSKRSKKPVIIGAVVGCVGGIGLLIGMFML